MEEFKVGDWVVVKSSGVVGHGYYNYGKHPIKIVEIKNNNFRYDLGSNPDTGQIGQTSSLYHLSLLGEKHFILNEIPNHEIQYEIC